MWGTKRTSKLPTITIIRVASYFLFPLARLTFDDGRTSQVTVLSPASFFNICGLTRPRGGEACHVHEA
jgi:hypothetical protein